LTALRNRLVANEGLLISRNGGINFYIGNNPDIKKTVGATPGIEWDKLLMLPYQTERITNFQEQDDFFSRKTVDYVLSDPIGWIRLMCKKTLWYFNAYEFPRNFDVYFFAQYSFLSKFPVFSLTLLFPLALAGMVLGFGFKRENIKIKNRVLPDTNVLLVLGIIFIYSFSIILVFVAARYRLPVIPLMILFAAFLLVSLYDLVLKKNIQKLVMPLTLVAVFAFITQQRFFFNEYPYRVSPVFTHTLLANTLNNAGQREEGKKFLEEAVRLPEDESTDDALFELGHYYRNTQEKEKAKECFYRSVKLDPNHFKSWNSLGFDLKI
jgi:tetratricopeptide (TPR) repeat protein